MNTIVPATTIILLAALITGAMAGDHKNSPHHKEPVSLEEFVDQRTSKLLADFDLNDDGIVEREELETSFGAEFRRMDADGDGVIDPRSDHRASNVQHQNSMGDLAKGARGALGAALGRGRSNEVTDNPDCLAGTTSEMSI